MERLIASDERHDLFWDPDEECFFINRDGDLIIDGIHKDNVAETWFEAVTFQGEDNEVELPK